MTTVIAATNISKHFSPQPCYNPHFKQLSVTTVIAATNISKHFSPQPCYNPHFKTFLSATLLQSTFQTTLRNYSKIAETIISNITLRNLATIHISNNSP
jgi:hypothetical protein